MANATLRRQYVQEMRRVYEVLGKPYTRDQYNEVGNVGSRTIEREFGTWKLALVAAKLDEAFAKARELDNDRKTYDPDSEVAKDWQERKNELRAKAEARKVKWVREQMNKIDLLKDMLEETLAKAEPPVVEVQPIRVVSKTKGKDGRRVTLWFEFSDLQLGTVMTAEQMGGLNKHNWVIWLEKLRIWKTGVIAMVRQYLDSGYQIDQVIIACLGDMVEGQDIFKGQVWQIDRHVVDQALLGANDTAGAFAEIVLTFPDLKFDILEVFGNHGRVGMKGDAPYSCSMDKVYQRMLEAQLLRCGAKNLHYHRNEAWFYLVEVYGWNHLLLHGDQGMSGLWSGRPTVNGLEKGITRYNQMLQQQIHFLHCGHFHQEWGLSFNMSYMLINGSFIGTSSFSASQMISGSPPIQMAHAFEPRVGLARSERIHLVEGDVRVPVTPASISGKRGG